MLIDGMQSRLNAHHDVEEEQLYDCIDVGRYKITIICLFQIGKKVGWVYNIIQIDISQGKYNRE